MNGGGYSTTRYVAYSLDGGDSWIRQQISDVYFTPKPIADAGYMGDYYETAAYGGQSWVAWSDDRVGGVFQAFVDTVMIRWQLSVDQHLENGSSIDSVDHWQEATHFVRYRAPASIWFSDGHTEVIRGTQNILSNQKFHKWNIDDSVTNHRPFHLQAGLTELISELKPTLGDITVKAALFDAPGVPGGNIQFRDPWYIDFVDPLYGNTRRNRGMDSAVFYFRSSPFNPGYSNPFPEGSYKGVFLNENSNWLPDRPNYAVSAPSQQTIGGYSSYFLNWSAHPDSAAFQDPYNDTTAVVFKKPAAIATAEYKARLRSSSSSVTAPVAQRKIVRDLNGKYHAFYESAAMIWYMNSTDGGANWSLEHLIAQGNPGMLYRNPSATVQRNPHMIVCVFEEYAADNSTHGVAYVKIDPSTGLYADGGTIWSDSHTIPPLKPVIATGTNSAGNEYLIVVWDSAGVALDGRVHTVSTLQWSASVRLRTASVSSATVAPICPGNVDGSGDYYWRLIWMERGDIHYAPITISTTPVLGTTADSIVARGVDGEIWLANPTTTSLWRNNARPGVAWEEYISTRVIKYRERPYGGGWGVIQVIGGSNYNTPTLTGGLGTGDLTIAWRSGSSQLKYEQRRTGSWTSQSNIGTGVDPTLSIGWQDAPTSELLLSRGTSSLYAVQNSTISYGQPKIDVAAADQQGRGGNLVYAGGRLGLAIRQATLGDTPLTFVALDDTLPITTREQFLAALRSEPFTGSGTLMLDLAFTSAGAVPGTAGFKVTLRDAVTDRTIATIRTLGSAKETVPSLQVPLSFAARTLRLAIEDFGETAPVAYEIERWHVASEGGAAEKEGEAPVTEGLVPGEYAVEQNYPNPFNPTTVIIYHLPVASDVKLAVFDMLGREAAVLVNERRDAGVHEVRFDGSGMASGVYVYRIQADGFVASKKLLLLK